MKKKLLVCVLLSVTFLKEISAQDIDSYITENYSNETVSRIYDLVNKTHINSIKQRSIAPIFKSQDSIRALMVRTGESQRAIDSVYMLYQNSWKSILSSIDEFYYSTETHNENGTLRFSYPHLLLVIKNQESIGFGNSIRDYFTSKIDSIKIKEEAFLSLYPGQLFNSYSLENGYINSVLSDNQYTEYIRIKGLNRANDKAKKDWDDLVLRGLSQTYDPGQTIQQFIDFYLAKDYAYGRFEKDEVKKRKALQTLYATEPEAVRKLYYARKYKNDGGVNRPSEFSQFLFAIKNAQKLGITDDKVKDLLTKSNELEVLKETSFAQDSTKLFDSRLFECVNLKQILSEEQYNAFLVLKNYGKSKNIALQNWRELFQRNVTAGHDKDSNVAVLTNYYLLKANTYDKYEDDLITQSAMIQEIAGNKPKSLLLLLHLRTNPNNNTILEGYEW